MNVAHQLAHLLMRLSRSAYPAELVTPAVRVARFGRKALIGLLLTAIGTLKFGFGASIATLWATFRITGDRIGVEISRFWATSCECLVPRLQKHLATLPGIYV